MTSPDPQRTAADPRLSAFVTANAGSGKTHTLIDRVARLLLAGAEPETILCVTYTKAAAAEMQRRLYGLLGDWSVTKGGPLRKILAALEGEPEDSYDEARLSQARALFAQALETPGGLKIQTIHAFCEKLLRRFPIEAGVSPGFRVMDDTATAAIAAAARKTVARLALKGDNAVTEAYGRFSVALDFDRFEAMFTGFEGRRGTLSRYLEATGGLEGAKADVWRACGFNGPSEPKDQEDSAMDALNLRSWLEAADVLDGGSNTDIACAKILREIGKDQEGKFQEALALFFTMEGKIKGEGTPATWINRSAALKKVPKLQSALLAEQDRLGVARERRRAATIGIDTVDALTLAQAYLTAFAQEKRRAGGLDFADLIEKAKALTEDAPQAAWVLFKMDGGIAHILVDEAQDTAPDQWAIVRALSAEFFSGAGQPRPGEALERNLFVVGDEKQSIYSFQGAAPEILDREFKYHRDRAQGAGSRFERVDLLASWRSTPEVLSLVDAVFAPETLTAAIVSRADGRLEPVVHQAVRAGLGHQGCVDLWPLLQDEPPATREAWTSPLDQPGEGSANRRLAERIAAEIAALIARGDGIYDKEAKVWRPARPGDVLILVRKRAGLFEEILRAIKRAKIPVAGADRLALSEHILFDDLVALARFVLFPADDLTLAALMRSPLCGFEDEDLYALAYARPASLWAALKARAGERPRWQGALDLLNRTLGLAGQVPPFEFYSRLLGDRDAEGATVRARLFRRLGAEAQDALDEFLAQVLAAEARGVRDLESLAAALVDLDITVKRELEGARNEVRVMTAHGAKGLEAPIVFLPETTASRGGRQSPLLVTAEGGVLWAGAKHADCNASAEARALRDAKEEAEAFRLLYVALTRARDRLVLCGRISSRDKEENLKGWWGALRDAFAHPGIVPHVRRVGDFERYGPDPLSYPAPALVPTVSPILPAWLPLPAHPEPYARYASPSDLGEGYAAPSASPLALSAGLGRFRRGDLIHRLLQRLPDIPLSDRPSAAERLLAREPDLTSEQRAEMVSATLAVLQDPIFADVFGPGSRAEVAVAGTAEALPPGLKISGRLDRLVVSPDRVLVIDFKTNRPAPSVISAADPAYLRQMALYAAVLAEIFPNHRIEAAIVWTDGPKLMPIPELLLVQTLSQLRADG